MMSRAGNALNKHAVDTTTTDTQHAGQVPASALAICSAIELHLCRWAFLYVLVTYVAFVGCDLTWWHIRWKDGSTVYDFAMVGIGFFWLGVIGLSKLALRIVSSPNAELGNDRERRRET